MSASHLIETVGWGLVHTSWLFLLPMVALILCRFCFPSASSEAKYWFSLAMLFALPLLAASWIAWTWQSPSLQTVQSSIPDQVNLQPSLALPITDDGVTQIDTLTSIELPAATPEFARTRIPASELLPPVTILPPDSRPLSISQQATELIQPKLPLVVFVWLGGVVLFSVRALLGLRFALRLQHRGLQAVDDDVQTMFRRLANHLGVTRGVRVMQSSIVKVPCVIGHFAPIVLLPAYALTGLSPDQLKAILAHELAHVRRRDYLVNILQICVESAFFYHPAVWYLSRLVRSYREECCDDHALLTCNDRTSLAKALLAVEQQASTGLGIAATDGSLLHRIRRIARGDMRAEGNRWVAGFVTLFAVGIISAVAFFSIKTAVAEDSPSVTEAANKAPSKVPLPTLTQPWLEGLPLEKARPERFFIDDTSWAEVLLVGSVDREEPIFWHANGELIDPPPDFDPATLIPAPGDHGSVRCKRQVVLRMVVPKDSDPSIFIGWQNEFERTAVDIDKNYKQIIHRVITEVPADHLPITVATVSEKWESLHQELPPDALTGGAEFNWCDVQQLNNGDIAVVVPRPDGHFRVRVTTQTKEDSIISAPSKTSPLMSSGLDELINERRMQNDWVMVFRRPNNVEKIKSIDVQRKPTLRTEIRNISVYPGPRTRLQVSATGRIDPGLELIEPDKSHQPILDLPKLKTEKRSIQGTLADSRGNPSANTWVSISHESSWWTGYFNSDHKFLAESKTDEQGRFSFDLNVTERETYSPTFLIWAVDADGTSCYARTTARKPVELKFDDAEATIRVVDASDQPVAGAKVMLESCKLPQGFSSRTPRRVSQQISLKTDEKGIVRIKGWPSEAINGLSVQSDAFGVQFLPSNLNGDWVKDGVLTLQLRPTVKILGRVPGFDPKRHAGLKLVANTMTYGRQTPVFGRAEVGVNERGGFSVASIAEGYLTWESSLSPQSESKLQLPYRQEIKPGQFLRQSFPILKATRVRQRLIKSDNGEPAAHLGLQVFWGASANRTNDSWGQSIKVKTDKDGWWTALVLPGKINVRLGTPRGYDETGWSDGRVDNYGLGFTIPETDKTVVLPEESFVRELKMKGKLVFSDGAPAVGWDLFGHPVSWQDVSTGGVNTDERGNFTVRYPEGYPPRVFEAKNSRWKTKYQRKTDELYGTITSRDPLVVELPVSEKP